MANAYVNVDDIQDALYERDGVFKAIQAFGAELDNVLDDLSVELVG